MGCRAIWGYRTIMFYGIMGCMCPPGPHGAGSEQQEDVPGGGAARIWAVGPYGAIVLYRAIMFYGIMGCPPRPAWSGT